jgi:hypothetical protein
MTNRITKKSTQISCTLLTDHKKYKQLLQDFQALKADYKNLTQKVEELQAYKDKHIRIAKQIGEAAQDVHQKLSTSQAALIPMITTPQEHCQTLQASNIEKIEKLKEKIKFERHEALQAHRKRKTRGNSYLNQPDSPQNAQEIHEILITFQNREQHEFNRKVKQNIAAEAPVEVQVNTIFSALEHLSGQMQQYIKNPQHYRSLVLSYQENTHWLLTDLIPCNTQQYNTFSRQYVQFLAKKPNWILWYCKKFAQKKMFKIYPQCPDTILHLFVTLGLNDAFYSLWKYIIVDLDPISIYRLQKNLFGHKRTIMDTTIFLCAPAAILYKVSVSWTHKHWKTVIFKDKSTLEDYLTKTSNIHKNYLGSTEFERTVIFSIRNQYDISLARPWNLSEPLDPNTTFHREEYAKEAQGLHMLIANEQLNDASTLEQNCTSAAALSTAYRAIAAQLAHKTLDTKSPQCAVCLKYKHYHFLHNIQICNKCLRFNVKNVASQNFGECQLTMNRDQLLRKALSDNIAEKEPFLARLQYVDLSSLAYFEHGIRKHEKKTL